MGILDIVFIVILGFTLIRGFFRGLVKEVASIVGVLAGLYFAMQYYSLLAPHLSSFITDRTLLNIASFAAIFCGLFFLISLLGVLLKYVLNIAFLGWVDRAFGAVFGFGKGVMISSTILMALTAFLPKNAPLVAESRVAPYIQLISANFSKMVSSDMKRLFEEKATEVGKTWKQRT
ncbi:CvpA family protein [Desulfobacterales bacterium HSG17]|nr:CvpA family protein [Desulfobacterales bacterium HSG17]